MLAYPRSLSHLDRRWTTVALWLGMGLGLALCYLGETWPTMLAGLLLFGGLATVRPDLALLFVPLTAPLFLTPIVLPANGQQLALPPHELALLATAAIALPGILVHRHRNRCVRATMDDRRWTMNISSIVYRPSSGQPAESFCRLNRLYRAASRYAPEALLLIAGVVGLCMAVPEPEARRDALRAFRWFIAEPLIFLALIRSRTFWRHAEPQVDILTHARRLISAFVIGGAAVALLGAIQFASFLLQAHSEPASFAAGAGALGGLRRVTSVYGNPNNLALYLGRVWPLAAVLAFSKNREQRTENKKKERANYLFFVLCSLLCLGGLLLSLSRGAWLGASAALIILIMPAAQRRFGHRLLPGLLIAGAVIMAVMLAIFALRGGLLGGSANVRILFWQESLKLLEQRPLGVGLDQFFYYHHPAYGRSQIDPALANTQERYARQPHNLVFELWLNLGPLGLLAFGWLLARWLGRAHATLRSPRSANAAAITHGALAALAAALVHGLVDSFYFWPDIAIAFWLLMAVSELISQKRRLSLPVLSLSKGRRAGYNRFCVSPIKVSPHKGP